MYILGQFSFFIVIRVCDQNQELKSSFTTDCKKFYLTNQPHFKKNPTFLVWKIQVADQVTQS